MATSQNPGDKRTDSTVMLDGLESVGGKRALLNRNVPLTTGEFMPSLTITDLPDDPLLHIMSYLNYRDLISFASVNSKLRNINLACNGAAWRKQCRIYWGANECPVEHTWQDEFIVRYRDFGRYIDIYVAVRRAWTQIETYLKNHCPQIHNSLRNGATEKELGELETALGIQLPNDMRCVYRIHNGQARIPYGLGLFGGIQNYNHYRYEGMLSLSLIQDLYPSCNGDSAACHGKPWLVPITFCDNSKTSQLISTQRAAHTVGASGEEADEISPSVNQVVYASEAPSSDLFISANSYLDMFTRYAQDLDDDRLQREKTKILRFYHDPKSTAVTQHVRITVATAFIPEMSHATPHPSRLVHAYRVTMSMDEDVPRRYTCQLTTRHWVITDENGHVERVDGPGVIGEYPRIGPGVTYSYISCTHFETNKGSMKGTYAMKNLATGEVFEAEVPEFHMQCYPYIVATQNTQCQTHL